MTVNEILRELLSLNLVAGLAIIWVLFTRSWIRAWFGARVAYVYWLLVPMAVIASLLPARTVLQSLQPSPSMLMQASSEDAGPGIPNQLQAVSVDTAQLNSQAAGAFNFAEIMPSMQELLMGVWIAGLIIAVAALVRHHRRFIKSLGRLSGDAAFGRNVFRSEFSHGGPASVGIIRPWIVLPADFETRFSERERAMIIAHERSHIATGDPVVNLLAGLAVCICWFNPLMHMASRQLRRDQELACDADTIIRFSGSRRIYAEALLKAQLTVSSPVLGCAWLTHPLKQRITGLAGTPRYHRQVGMLVNSILILLAATVSWAAQSPVVITESAESSRVLDSQVPETDSLRGLNGNSGEYAALPQTSVYAADSLELEEIAARLTVIPESRNDIALTIMPSGLLPQPDIQHQGNHLLISGGLQLSRYPCLKRYGGQGAVSVPRYGDIPLQDLPEIIARVPYSIDLSVHGLVLAEIGPSSGGMLENHGCGDVYIEDASGPLDVALYGYGDIDVGQVDGPITAELFGFGEMRLDSARAARLELIGMGNLIGGEFAESVVARLQGEGDMRLEHLGNGAELKSSGTGEMSLGTISGSVKLEAESSAPVSIGTVNGPLMDIEAGSIGSVDIQQGLVDQFKVHVKGPGGIYFGGSVGFLEARLNAGSGDIFVGSAERMETRGNGPDSGAVKTGK